MLFLATTIKLLAEIALMALAGQWLLGLVVGDGKGSNPFYRVLQGVGKPWMMLARWLSRGIVLDRYLPLVAVLMVVSVWLVATISKVSICLSIGVALCR